MAVVFDLLSYTASGGPFAVAAYYSIWAGVIFGVAAILTGFVDYVYEIPAGSDVYWTATVHMLANIAAWVLFIVNLAFRFGKAFAPVPLLPLALSAIGAGLIVISSTLGGFMVFRHGIRVMTMHNHRHQAQEWREREDSDRVA